MYAWPAARQAATYGPNGVLAGDVEWRDLGGVRRHGSGPAGRGQVEDLGPGPVPGGRVADLKDEVGAVELVRVDDQCGVGPERAGCGLQRVEKRRSAPRRCGVDAGQERRVDVADADGTDDRTGAPREQCDQEPDQVLSAWLVEEVGVYFEDDSERA